MYLLIPLPLINYQSRSTVAIEPNEFNKQFENLKIPSSFTPSPPSFFNFLSFALVSTLFSFLLSHSHSYPTRHLHLVQETINMKSIFPFTNTHTHTHTNTEINPISLNISLYIYIHLLPPSPSLSFFLLTLCRALLATPLSQP